MDDEGVPEDRHAVRLDGEPGPFASLLPREQTSLGEQREVMADGWLASVEDSREIAAAHRGFGCVGDQAQDPKTDRIRQQLETARQFLRFIGIDRFDKDGFTTRGDELHTNTLPSY